MRRTVAGLLVTLMVAAGCADESSGRTGEDPTAAEKGAPAPAGVRFTSTVTVESDQVLIDWTVVNGSETGVLVADLVPPRGHLVADGTPLAAYAVSAGDRVELAQRVFTWPDTDRTWAVAPRIGVTRLRAGARLERRLAVPLPLAAHHPFGGDLGDGPVTLPAAPAEAVFCLGVLAPPHDPALDLTREDGIESVEHGRVPFQSQHVFCSEPVELPAADT